MATSPTYLAFRGLTAVNPSDLYLATKEFPHQLPEGHLGLISFAYFKVPTAEEVIDELTLTANLLMYDNNAKEYFNEVKLREGNIDETIDLVRRLSPPFQELLAKGADWIEESVKEFTQNINQEMGHLPGESYLRLQYFLLDEEEIPNDPNLTKEQRINLINFANESEAIVEEWCADILINTNQTMPLSMEELAIRIQERTRDSSLIKVDDSLSEYPLEELLFLLPAIYQTARTFSELPDDSMRYLYDRINEILEFNSDYLQQEFNGKKNEEKRMLLKKRMQARGITGVITTER
jgi:hypothetical protein